MQAIDILMQEHRVIEKVLDSLETAINRLSTGYDVPVDFFRSSNTNEEMANFKKWYD